MAIKIYTKTGDKGTTALFGGTRLPKYDLRITAYGTVDELNSIVGIILTYELPPDIHQHLTKLSSLLFTLGSDLATPLQPPPVYNIPRIQDKHITWMEDIIDSCDNVIPALKTFILPGGTKASAYLHLARTVCRRAERHAVELAEREDIGTFPVVFLNRCSDMLFTVARYVNYKSGVDDVPWLPESD